jgi:hypothetical protein
MTMIGSSLLELAPTIERKLCGWRISVGLPMPKSKQSHRQSPITVTVQSRPKQMNTTKPKNKNKRPRGARAKGLLSTALDVAEGVSSFLPGAIRGVRGLFNAREADFATPASFAVVRNNTSQMVANGRVTHPSLGISGTRVHFTQPLCYLRVSPNVDPSTGTFFVSYPPFASLVTPNVIALNPVQLGGALSVEAALHDRFVFRSLRVIFTTSQTTNQLGQGVLNIEKDSGSVQVTDFGSAMMCSPNLLFPFRIPKAELDYLYDGPELYYCANATGGAASSSAESRQNWQALIEGWANDYTLSATMGFLTIEGVIDFFEPIPPSTLIGSTVEERQALALVRSLHKQQSSFAYPPSASLTPEVLLKGLTQMMIRDGMVQAPDSSHACVASCHCMTRA